MLKEHQAGLYSMHCSASQTEFEGKEKNFHLLKNKLKLFAIKVLDLKVPRLISSENFTFTDNLSLRYLMLQLVRQNTKLKLQF